jgi:hypothetical protein
MENLSCPAPSSCRGAMATVMERTVGVFASFHNPGIGLVERHYICRLA